ncbi:hypothetical protein [Pseudonocardia sp. WMMC193]|uniref:hypothetical protein n=1 Tax=Pseudonocardia sp. WMMC193 TaxID=2911965 RepID=UPI001F378C5A|nr:hypothetical protein [Pseudonocardia sp. WMMC193]MCF7552187.1 hypothetical protein [Pseudonocardia sp. WMMC193]
MRWKVGVLRPGCENVDWTASGVEATWTRTQRRACDELRQLVAVEGAGMEYRMQVGSVPVYVWPGVDVVGRLDLDNLTGGVLPAEL